MQRTGIYITVSSHSGFWSYGHFDLNWFGIPNKYMRVAHAALTTQSPPKRRANVLSMGTIEANLEKKRERLFLHNYNPEKYCKASDTM
ncbi:hypothetical protein MRX96_032932 [Rhipicephalus microplus]